MRSNNLDSLSDKRYQHMKFYETKRVAEDAWRGTPKGNYNYYYKVSPITTTKRYTTIVW